MPRTGDTFAFDSSIANWANPAISQNFSISGWNALRNDLVDALTQSLSRTDGTMIGALGLANGANNAPSLRFASEPDAGFYRAAANTHRWCNGTADILELTATDLRVKRGGTFYPVQAELGYGAWKLAGAGLPVLTGTGALGTWTEISQNSAGSFTVDSSAGTITINTAGVYQVGFHLGYTIASDFLASIGFAVDGSFDVRATALPSAPSTESTASVALTAIATYSAAQVLTLRRAVSAGSADVYYSNIFIRRIA